MPWSNQGGGGNGGGWKSGGNGGGPWGQGPSGGGSGGSGGGGGQQPDLEEILKRSQDRFKQMGGGKGSWGLGALLGVAGLMMFIGYLCFVTINPNEVGVKLRFGKFAGQLPEGFHFKLPDPFETVQKVPVTQLQRTEVGFRNQNVDTGRYRSGGDSYPEESLMLTGDENIVDLDFVVIWNIKSAPNYVFNIQNPIGTVKVVAESAMREIIGQRDIQPILTQDRGQIESEGVQLIQKTLDAYKSGINVVEVQMLRVDPPNEVIGSFRDVQAAKADQERAQNEANAYGKKIVPEARGEAERITQAAQAYKEKNIAEAKGKADRFNKVYGEYSKAPEVTRRRMYLETMERVFGNTDKIIIDNSAGGGVVPYLPLNELNKSSSSSRGQ